MKNGELAGRCETEKHDIKLAPGFLQDILSGKKTFEVRKDDRDFQVNDIVLMRETDYEGYSGKQIRVKITYVLRGQYALDFGLQKGFCAWSFVPIESLLPVVKLNKSGEEIEHYPSESEAARQNNVAASNINHAIKQKTHSNGYYWKHQ